jgi:uncharacterized membrane protein YhiD involved in acid resistance
LASGATSPHAILGFSVESSNLSRGPQDCVIKTRMSKPSGKRFEHRQPGLEDKKAGTSAVGSPAREVRGLRLSCRSAAVVAALLLGIGALSLGAYVVFGRSIGPAAQQVSSAAAQVVRAADQSTPAAVDEVGEDIFSQIFGSERSPSVVEQGTGRLVHAAKVTFRLLLASLLAAMLAFRPHKYTPALRRNPHVAETQILLAVVASALMMIVADNAARAFGIFAAASLVRFRTNIRDPKEITVLLINLAIGLAAGVGRWELAVILSVFVLATLWILEYFESRQVVRAMQLKVKTHNVAETDDVLRKVFERYHLTSEVREVNREDQQDPIGRIVYALTVGPRVSTDQLSEEIFSADPNNIDTVEWHQKKSVSYAYR